MLAFIHQSEGRHHGAPPPTFGFAPNPSPLAQLLEGGTTNSNAEKRDAKRKKHNNPQNSNSHNYVKPPTPYPTHYPTGTDPNKYQPIHEPPTQYPIQHPIHEPPTQYPTGTDPYIHQASYHYQYYDPYYYYYPPQNADTYYVAPPPTQYPTGAKPTPFPTDRITSIPTRLPTPNPTPDPTPEPTPKPHFDYG
jgi:hypothetical protein